MNFVQPVHLCERDPHLDHVVVVNASKRETDKRVAYFELCLLGDTLCVS